MPRSNLSSRSRLERELVRRLMAAFFRLEMKQAGVVTVVGLLKELPKAGVDIVMRPPGLEPSVIFNAAVFANAQEDDAVNDALDGKVGFALGEFCVAQRQILGEGLAPGFDGLEKGIVYGGGAALGFVLLGVFVERAFEDGFAGEDAGDFIPARCIFRKRNIEECERRTPCLFDRALRGSHRRQTLQNP